MWNPDKIDARLWKLGLAAVTLTLVAGCGGSSSGDGDDDGDTETETSSLSDDEAAAVAVAAVIDYESYAGGDMGLSLTGDNGETDSSTGTTGALSTSDNSDDGMDDLDEACGDAGTIEEKEEDGEIVSIKLTFENCTFNPEDLEDGFEAEVFLNGSMELLVGEDSEREGFEHLTEASYDGWETRVSLWKSEDEGELVYEAGFGLDGVTANHFTDPTTDPSLQILNFETESHAFCDGKDYDFTAAYDLEILSTPRDSGIAVESNGSVDNGDEVVEIETLEEVFSEPGELFPREGELNVSHGGVETHIEFVEGGLYINGDYQTWDEFEDELAEQRDTAPAYAECFDED